MLYTQERRRMMRQMEDQSLVEKAIVARCAAALGVVVLIAAIGAVGPDGGAAATPLEVRMPARAMVASSADAHRHEIFEQRRQHFVDGHSGLPQADVSPGIGSAK
jgi:hypothetical protein